MSSTTTGSRDRLIEQVRRAPLLWDTRHELHRDHEARDRQWADIAATLRSNSETIKREWKILRDCMRQSLKTARRGGVLWRHHNAMAFLMPHITRRPSTRRALDDVSAALDSTPDGARVTAADDAADALELFFASVCTAARALPAASRRRLQRAVLDALLAAERDAADTASAAAGRGRDAADTASSAAAGRDGDTKTFNFHNSQ